MKPIYVSNLAYTATAKDIRRLFEPFGELAAAYVYTYGKSRFSFLWMTNEADAESAIEALNSNQFSRKRTDCSMGE
jgi:RNA recognition motif-containing protein